MARGWHKRKDEMMSTSTTMTVCVSLSCPNPTSRLGRARSEDWRQSARCGEDGENGEDELVALRLTRAACGGDCGMRARGMRPRPRRQEGRGRSERHDDEKEHGSEHDRDDDQEDRDCDAKAKAEAQLEEESVVLRRSDVLRLAGRSGVPLASLFRSESGRDGAYVSARYLAPPPPLDTRIRGREGGHCLPGRGATTSQLSPTDLLLACGPTILLLSGAASFVLCATRAALPVRDAAETNAATYTFAWEDAVFPSAATFSIFWKLALWTWLCVWALYQHLCFWTRSSGTCWRQRQDTATSGHGSIRPATAELGAANDVSLVAITVEGWASDYDQQRHHVATRRHCHHCQGDAVGTDISFPSTNHAKNETKNKHAPHESTSKSSSSSSSTSLPPSLYPTSTTTTALTDKALPKTVQNNNDCNKPKTGPTRSVQTSLGPWSLSSAAATTTTATTTKTTKEKGGNMNTKNTLAAKDANAATDTETHKIGPLSLDVDADNDHDDEVDVNIDLDIDSPLGNQSIKVKQKHNNNTDNDNDDDDDDDDNTKSIDQPKKVIVAQNSTYTTTTTMATATATATATAPMTQQLPPERFITAEKGNIINAQRRYRETLTWRKEMRMDTILTEPHPNFALIKSNYPHCYHLRGKNNEPCYYESPPKMKLQPLRDAGLTMDDLLRHYALTCEYMWTHIEPSERGKSIYVIDLEGMGIRDFAGDVVDFVKRTSAFTSAHYPERSGSIFVLNVPSWFSIIYNTVKPWVDEVTRQKITILKSGNAKAVVKALATKIDLNNIPPEYGGMSVPLGQAPEEIAFRKKIESNNHKLTHTLSSSSSSTL